MSKCALVTGATGFVGRALVSNLTRQGWAVHALVRPSSNLGSVSSTVAGVHLFDGTAASLERAVSTSAPHVTIHLAAETLDDGSAEAADRLIATNVRLPVLLARACIDGGCKRWIQAGTFWQHKQDGAYSPRDLYAATKQACEDLLQFYHEVHGLSCVNLKLFDNFGPGDQRPKLINLLLRAAVLSKPIDLSPGGQLLDLIHIDDLCAAFEHAANFLLEQDKPLLETSFVSGERLTVKQLVAIIQQRFPDDLNFRLGARPYREREIMVPVEGPRGRALVGWQPRRSVAESLTELIASCSG